MFSLVEESSLGPDGFWDEQIDSEKVIMLDLEPPWPVYEMLTCTTWTPDFAGREKMLLYPFGILNKISLLRQSQETQTFCPMPANGWYLNYIQGWL